MNDDFVKNGVIGEGIFNLVPGHPQKPKPKVKS